MDSLLATYSSSDEEDDQTPKPPQPSSKPSLFSCLPKPQSSSLSIFSSLPPPKSTTQTLKQQDDSSSKSSSTIFSQSTSGTLKTEEDPLSSNSTSSLFNSLPPPKSETATDFPLPPATARAKPKRIVQFRPPVPQPNCDEDEEEEDEDDKRRKKQTQMIEQDTSVKTFLSSMPTPKSSGHTSLGAGASSLGSGRRSIIETEAPPSNSPVNVVNDEVGYVSNNYDQLGVSNYEVVGGPSQHQGGYAADYGGDYSGNSDTSNWYYNTGDTPSVPTDSFARLGGKRRKDQPPADFIEVNQDELMKNRPTEDKSKLTGIAFGPSYQPVSTKGKPSKLHKRKHQIGALYFDMKQKEMELTERRARGFLTKAETQAKYGW